MVNVSQMCMTGLHHHLHHSNTFHCLTCFKVSPTPSLHKAHLYSHRANQYKCVQCNKSFPFLSGISYHKRAHLKQCLFECFAGSCCKAFKHRQDLHLHISHHFKAKFTCIECGHGTYEKRLLKCHYTVHEDKFKYKCCRCPFKTKYKWSITRHEKSCH